MNIAKSPILSDFWQKYGLGPLDINIFGSFPKFN